MALNVAQIDDRPLWVPLSRHRGQAHAQAYLRLDGFDRRFLLDLDILHYIRRYQLFRR